MIQEWVCWKVHAPVLESLEINSWTRMMFRRIDNYMVFEIL